MCLKSFIKGRTPREAKLWRALGVVAGTLALLGMEVVFSSWATDRQERLTREDILNQARRVAQALDVDQIRRLEGNASDGQKSEYRRLKEQLMAIRQIDPDWTRVYVMNRAPDGTVFFLADSTAGDVSGACPPGQPYGAPPEIVREVFNTGTPTITQPARNRREAGISIFVPIQDPQTDHVLAVMGMDVGADRWMRSQAMRLPLISCVALFAIWLGGNYLVARRARRKIPETRFYPYLETTLVLISGLALTLIAVWLSRQNETNQQQLAFQRMSETETGLAFGEKHELRNLELAGSRAFFENGTNVTLDQFRQYVAHLDYVPAVRFWCWVEAVDAAGVKTFEEKARALTGDPRYRIWQRTKAGAPVSPDEPALLYPILYESAAKDRESTLGFDLGSDPAHRAALESAARSRLVTASAPIFSLKAPHHCEGILVLYPVFFPDAPATLKGFVAASLRMEDWLKSGGKTDAGHRPMAILDLYELRVNRPPLWLGSTAHRPERISFDAYPRESLFSFRPLLIFGKTYLLMARPTKDFYAMHPRTQSWLVGLAGCMITGGLALTLGFFTRHRVDLIRRVNAQNLALESSHDRYNLLAKKNRAVTWEVNTAGLYVSVSSMSEAVFGYRPDEMIGRLHPYDLHPPKGRDAFKHLALEMIRRGESVADWEHTVESKTGELVWISVSGMPVQNEAGTITGYWGTSTDITRRKLNEQALSEVLNRYNLLAKQIRSVTWSLDQDGLYTGLGEETLHITGLQPETLVGRKYFYELHPEEGREAFKTKILGIMGKGEPIRNLIHPVVNTSGGGSWFETSGIPIRDDHHHITGYWGISTDITESKRKEEELAFLSQRNWELAERYKTLVSASNTGAWEYNPDPARIWESPEYFHMLGLDPAQFDRSRRNFNENDVWLNRLHPDDLPRARKVFYDYLKNPEGMYEQTFRMRHADGHWIWILSRGRMQRDEKGRPTGALIGTHIDITSAKQAETELRESRRQYEALLANLPGMAYRRQNDGNWTTDFVSRGCSELTGYGPEDLVGNRTLSLNDLICPPYREEVRRKWQEALLQHGHYMGEYEIATRTGEVKWVWEQGEGVFDEEGRCVAMEGFISDITAHKRAQNERERLSLAIEQSNDAVIIADTKGNICYVNPAFSRMSGFSREEVLGQNVRILKSGQHEDAFYRQLWDVLLSGNTWEGKITNRRKDGVLYTERMSISPVRDAFGHVVHYVAVQHDITRQLRDSEEKRELEAQLAHAQKLESVGRLAGGVAHDFNNMLQAILGYVQIALDQVPADQPLHADLEEIQKAATRSTALTAQLQTFARKQAIAPKILDINTAVEGMLGMLRRLIGEDIRLDWNPGEDTGFVRMDPGQLDQIVVNLCINARDAVGGSGQITIETSGVEFTARDALRHHNLEVGPYVRLSFRDNGCGMTQDVIDHIFEPFFTTKPLGKGTGLGLAIVYGIVKQNGGSIDVESAPGEGSVFHIHLPGVQPVAGGTTPTAAAAGAAKTSRHGTLLLVDDESALLLTTRRLLEALGYRVLSTTSPHEALRICEEEEGKIDLLLTDVVMSEMNGPELARKVRKNYPRIRCLFMSGYTAHLLAERGMEENLVDLIFKPFSKDDLAQRISAALEEK